MSYIEIPFPSGGQTSSRGLAAALGQGLSLGESALVDPLGAAAAAGGEALGKQGLEGKLSDALERRALRGYDITFILPSKEQEEPSRGGRLFEETTSSVLAEAEAQLNTRLPSKGLIRRRFTLPNSPQMWIRMENQIVSELVARERNSPAAAGSIKERWGRHDLALTISGVLLGGAYRLYPIFELQQLQRVFEHAAVGIRHTILNALGVQQLVIKRLELPPTEGNNQRYVLHAVSDNEDYTLLEENTAATTETATEN